MARTVLRFESRLASPRDEVWAWAVSVDGVLAEMWPLARMTLPAGARTLIADDVELGKPLARSWLLLFGVLPVDRTDLTLVEYESGRRFLERSPMLGMRLWQHERTIDGDADATTLTDELTFEPRVAAPLVGRFVDVFFTHRHAVLRRRFGENPRGDAA